MLLGYERHQRECAKQPVLVGPFYSGGVKAKDVQTLLELTPDGEEAMRFKTGYQKDMEESYQNGEAKGLERGLSLLDEKNLEVVSGGFRGP